MFGDGGRGQRQQLCELTDTQRAAGQRHKQAKPAGIGDGQADSGNVLEIVLILRHMTKYSNVGWRRQEVCEGLFVKKRLTTRILSLREGNEVEKHYKTAFRAEKDYGDGLAEGVTLDA